jgi:starch synthase (maltosyl-transferring)
MWHGARNFVQLDPHQMPAHVFRIRRWQRSEREFEYFM